MDTVPEAHQEAAEEIRAHLVAVRGGAPFLSPSDARTLVAWLETGVAVHDILRAVERLAESRRKLRSRLPITLTGAKRHLGRPTAGALRTVEPDRAHPLAPLARALRAQASADPRAAGLLAVADRFEALEAGDPDRLVRDALAATRDFLRAAWDALPPADRAARLDEARAVYAGELYDADLEAAAEAFARESLREQYPLLGAATVCDLVYR